LRIWEDCNCIDSDPFLQLGVVVASLARGRASLAAGNVVGSSISNILGAFSLGLLFNRAEKLEFDQSSKVYSLLLFILTTAVIPIFYFPGRLVWAISGGLLVAAFVLYLAGIAWAISRGQMTAPEGSDDGSSDDEDTSDDEGPREHYGAPSRGQLATPTASEFDPLISRPRARSGSSSLVSSASSMALKTKKRKSLLYHILILVVGFVALTIASYILSHTATSITDALKLSDAVFGVVVLSLATTLPEKLVAVLSGFRGHHGIMVANTVGSNIFLLSLCTGVLMLDGSGKITERSVSILELSALWVSTALFTIVIWFGGGHAKPIGVVMLVGYFGFLAAECLRFRD
jgi:Ca2+/Na+ antiporter